MYLLGRCFPNFRIYNLPKNLNTINMIVAIKTIKRRNNMVIIPSKDIVIYSFRKLI
jgi:hypothetical protein